MIKKRGVFNKPKNYQEMCDMNENVTKMGMFIKGGHYIRHYGQKCLS
jgi:hypothetical protein